MKKLMIFALAIGATLSSCSKEELAPKEVAEFEGVKMVDVITDDWNLEGGTFIAESGQAFVWERGQSNGAYNLAAAVYFSADWNTELKEVAKNSVINNIVNESAPRGWDLLIYDDYTDSNVFDAWMAAYGENGVVKASKLRPTYYYYDALGTVIGLHRAKEAGVMTQENYDASIAVAKARIAELGGATEEYQHAFFAIVEQETGVKLTEYNTTVDIDALEGAQDLGFAARAFGAEALGTTRVELQVMLIKASLEANTSLGSIDAISGFYFVD